MTQSNEPTIEQMNEVISIFDGWEFRAGDPNHKCPYCIGGDEPCTPAVDRFYKYGHVRFHYQLKYHESWDALKPIIDKVVEYALVHPEAVKPVIEMSIVVCIKAAHEKVYQFITWLNQQPTTNE